MTTLVSTKVFCILIGYRLLLILVREGTRTQPHVLIDPARVIYRLFNTTLVMATTFSSSNLLATSCRLTGIP
jgi:hypothetical protein